MISIIVIAIVAGLILGIISIENAIFLKYYLIGWSIAFLGVPTIRYLIG